MSNVSNISIPSTAADITPEWVAAVTGLTVVPDGFQIEGEIQAGIGFQSSMCRVVFKIANGQTKNVILKLLPTDPKWLEYALDNRSDEKEINFYAMAVPDLVQALPEIQDNVCQYYYSSIQPAAPAKGIPKSSVLIMEDMKALGYDMMHYGGDTANTNGLVKAIARFHLGSLAVEASKGLPLSTLYPFIKENIFFDQMKKVCGESFKNLKELFIAQNVSEKVILSYDDLQPYATILAEKVDEMSKTNPCLIHGDIWPPNVLVHPSLPLKLIDWQLVVYRNPSIDLVMVMYMTLPIEDLNVPNLKRIFDSYRQECEKIYKENGLQDKFSLWDWEDFEKFAFTWGISYLFVLLVGCLECVSQDGPKYANLFRMLSEDNGMTHFLINECKKDS